MLGHVHFYCGCFFWSTGWILREVWSIIQPKMPITNTVDVIKTRNAGAYWVSDELVAVSTSCPSPRCLAWATNAVVVIGVSIELLNDWVAVVKVDMPSPAVLTRMYHTNTRKQSENAKYHRGWKHYGHSKITLYCYI